MIRIAIASIDAEGGNRREREVAATLRALHALERKATLSHTESGAPFIENHPGLAISISHSATYAAVAICKATDGPIGIDIEAPREQLRKVAPRFLSETELADMGEDPLLTTLQRAWTSKEATYKAALTNELPLAEGIRLDVTHTLAYVPKAKRTFALAHYELPEENILTLAAPFHTYDRQLCNKTEIITLYDR